MRLASRSTLFLIFLLSFFGNTFAQSIPEKPKKLYPVYDQANLLSAEEKELLNQKLIKFSDSTSTEIEVIILPTTGGQDINFLATMYGEKWGIGQKGVDNGVVFMIATEDRKFAIQQGRAVEQYLTASVAGQILDYLVTPAFRKGDWYDGIDKGTTAIMEAVQGKFKPKTKKKSESVDAGTVFFIVILILIFVVAIGGGGNNNDDDDVLLSGRGSRRYRGGMFPFPGSFGGGGFGGRSSGGGFGGFGGGGSFGGGGASGGW